MITQKNGNVKVQAKRLVSVMDALLNKYKWGYRFGLVKKIKRIKNKEIINDEVLKVCKKWLLFIEVNDLHLGFNKIILAKLEKVTMTLEKIDRAISDSKFQLLKRQNSN